MRADVFLTEGGYVSSRQRARTLIERGLVTVDGVCIKKPSQPISDGEHTVLVSDDLPYVGRGGLKLEAALDAFSLSVEGLFALDIGASTGGFTDCLLQRGAASVCAVDSGAGQLADKLASNPRVVSLEHTNARDLTLDQIGGEAVDLIVMDVSFISATYILPRFKALLKKNGRAICLIKPQFEVGRTLLGKGGIVRDPEAHRYAVERVFETARTVGLTPVGLIASPIEGGDGNREFLACFINHTDAEGGVTDDEIARVTRTARARKGVKIEC